jgi:DNA-directed RNA polymerase subunit beta
VLNPLGVPSRMNVGQILETHLGWAARASSAADRCSTEQRRGRRACSQAAQEDLLRQGSLEFIDALSDEEVCAFADKLRKGVHIADAGVRRAPRDRDQGAR